MQPEFTGQEIREERATQEGMLKICRSSHQAFSVQQSADLHKEMKELPEAKKRAT